jgi:hypothetical protein
MGSIWMRGGVVGKRRVPKTFKFFIKIFIKILAKK